MVVSETGVCQIGRAAPDYEVVDDDELVVHQGGTIVENQGYAGGLERLEVEPENISSETVF